MVEEVSLLLLSLLIFLFHIKLPSAVISVTLIFKMHLIIWIVIVFNFVYLIRGCYLMFPETHFVFGWGLMGQVLHILHLSYVLLIGPKRFSRSNRFCRPYRITRFAGKRPQLLHLSIEQLKVLVIFPPHLYLCHDNEKKCVCI